MTTIDFVKELEIAFARTIQRAVGRRKPDEWLELFFDDNEFSIDDNAELVIHLELGETVSLQGEDWGILKGWETSWENFQKMVRRVCP